MKIKIIFITIFFLICYSLQSQDLDENYYNMLMYYVNCDYNNLKMFSQEIINNLNNSENNSTLLSAYYYNCLSYYALGNYDKCIEIINTIFDKSEKIKNKRRNPTEFNLVFGLTLPSTYYLYYQILKKNKDKHDLELVKKYFEESEINNIFPNNFFYFKSLYFFSEEDYEKALYYNQQSIIYTNQHYREEDNNYNEIVIPRIFMFYRLSHFDNAIEIYNNYDTIDDLWSQDIICYYLWMSLIFEETKNYEKAELCFQNANKIIKENSFNNSWDQYLNYRYTFEVNKKDIEKINKIKNMCEK